MGILFILRDEQFVIGVFDFKAEVLEYVEDHYGIVCKRSLVVEVVKSWGKKQSRAYFPYLHFRGAFLYDFEQKKE